MSPISKESIKTTHYNDWPNTQGFDVQYEELNPTELEVTGIIPAYCAGVLFRNGLGPRGVEKDGKEVYKVSHWFDNLAQVHRFHIHAPTTDHSNVRVTHNSRLTCDGLVKRIQKTGFRGEVTFGAKYDPCLSLFQKAQSFFTPSLKESPDSVNIGVTLSVNFPGLSRTGTKRELPIDNKSGVQTLCNKTDNSTLQMLDPETLEPIGVAKQTTLHPDLKGPISASHAKTDPVTGEVYNYNLEMGPMGHYRVFTVSPSTGKTSILATIKNPPAYVHSMFLTENYVILCVWSSHFRMGGLPILFSHNLVDALADYETTKLAKWFVVDRKVAGRGLVATYESDAFFSFHTINAYEEPSTKDPSKIDIVADVCAYDSLDVLKRFYIGNLLSNSPTAKPFCDPSNKNARAAFRRFRLASLPPTANSQPLRASIEFSHEKGVCPELPSINPGVRGRKHRYVYGVTDSGKSSFIDGLVKFDVETTTSLYWSEHAQTAGEPIFVPDPKGNDEDSGVLLTVVLDGIGGKSYLLVLDAKTMTEIGRAKVDGVVGFGFHGVHVPDI
ncbi:putative beta-carotene dioxygenase [Talaromyces proteolyticus]|uniref:Beta-carotene dioxygenase n=1 Tax=Talaromyces proteolyticus TaxID=1131652 RepID=A0AAD4PRZ3_9EURO|nr:putative beta-carotene dioxygenase [Talaromyces proteolyticus]KAH8690100.1 putative beta-carotene dioxygenase [Talaromyces proteolyticus]